MYLIRSMLLCFSIPVGVCPTLFIDEHLNFDWFDPQPIRGIVGGELALARQNLLGCRDATIVHSCSTHSSHFVPPLH